MVSIIKLDVTHTKYIILTSQFYVKDINIVTQMLLNKQSRSNLTVYDCEDYNSVCMTCMYVCEYNMYINITNVQFV